MGSSIKNRKISMISSMTGYGRSEVAENGIAVTAEVRSVNSRYLEVTMRLPRSIILRENDVKELVRMKLVRGKINIVVNIMMENGNDAPLKINVAAAKAYYTLLNQLRKAVKIQEKVTLEHLLKFSEVLEIDEAQKGDDKEWSVVEQALANALDEVALMRQREGGELMKDLSERINGINNLIEKIERLAQNRLPEERTLLLRRVQELVTDKSIIDEQRLELEIALLADKLDVTEECVRFRSHNNFFLETLINETAAGRKLNFLVQEMNREANTIGSKSSNAEIAHMVVAIKEELEKIREQLQNIE
jgi:uncharacterized protein (TIGR00255 family)